MTTVPCHGLADIRTQAALSVESRRPEVIRTLVVVMDLHPYLSLLERAHFANVDPENLEDMMTACLAASCTSCDAIRLKLKEMIMDVVARSYIKRIRID